MKAMRRLDFCSWARILVVTLRHLGDILLAMPLLRDVSCA